MFNKSQVHSLLNEMTDNLSRLVKYNTVRAEALPGMPFGQANADCLAEALQISEDLGFQVTNVDNYCGYAEMGSGKDIIGIVGHLDIVPAGDDWNTDPFTMTVKDGIAYGRGLSDDKGPMIAALYAMKLVRESGVPLNKRVRLLFGCNEETGSRCMAYYNAHEEPITIGFTPDGDFPGIHGEKGSCSMTVFSKNTAIISMQGGFVSNAVCNRCTTEIPADAVNVESLKEELAKTDLVNVTVTLKDQVITIEAQGVSAHASTPLRGVNAAACTMQALQAAGMEDDFVDFYMEHVGTSCDGNGVGLKISDAYGDLTFCNSMVKTEDGVIKCTIDIRYPVTFAPQEIIDRATPHLETEKGKIVINGTGKPLFYPEDSHLVQCLYQAYVAVTGDTENKPEVIGGGTYAKSIPGIIAFGNKFPNTDNHIHDANERLVLDELEDQVLIYAQAILNLLND